jgi:hypothetical protein
MAYQMVAFENFRTDTTATLHRDLKTQGFIDKNIQAGDCAGYPTWKWTPSDISKPTLAGNLSIDSRWYRNPYTNPDWATTHGPTWNDGDDTNQSGNLNVTCGLVNNIAIAFPTEAAAVAAIVKYGLGPSGVWSLDDVEAAIQKSKIQTDYFNRDHVDGLTTTLAAITFPAKYLHFNYFTPFPTVAGWNPAIGDWNEATAEAYRALIKVAPAGVPIKISVWDMEEHKWGNSPQVTSPLPYEVNLIPVGSRSQEYFAGWPLLYAQPNVTNVGPLVATYDWGWFYIEFDTAAQFVLGTSPTTSTFKRGYSIFPGVNGVMDYENANYPHSRLYPWNWFN